MVPTTITPAIRTRAVLPILAMAVFFVGASEFMLAAMLTPLSVAFHADAVQVSWLISSYAFAYACAAPFLGYLADRFNRSRLLLAGLLSFAIDGAGIAFAPTFEIAVALRFFGGLASAIIIPTAFALVSELFPRERHAAAMGVVMLGMTLGIALGPAVAGILTTYAGWRAPFLLASFGCLLALVIGMLTLQWRQAAPAQRARQGLRWLHDWRITRPLLAKGLWNGTGVAAFLLSGEVLRQRYHLSPEHVGLSVTAFGVGLGLGNLSAGTLRVRCGSEETALVIVTALLAAAIAAFTLPGLPLPGALLCLAAWGAALGAGAPLATAVLANRSNQDKGMVLACAETLNNVVIMAVVPAASIYIARSQFAAATLIFVVGLSIGASLVLYDARDAGFRRQ